MKILFVMDTPEYLRFYDSAIEEMAARGHSVAIAVNHLNAKKPVGLKGLSAYADRVRVFGVVPSHEGHPIAQPFENQKHACPLVAERLSLPPALQSDSNQPNGGAASQLTHD